MLKKTIFSLKKIISGECAWPRIGSEACSDCGTGKNIFCKSIKIWNIPNLIFDILLKHLEFKGLSHLHNENNNDDNDNIWKSRVFPTFTLRSLAQKGSLPLRTGDNKIFCAQKKNWAEKRGKNLFIQILPYWMTNILSETSRPRTSWWKETAVVQLQTLALLSGAFSFFTFTFIYCYRSFTFTRFETNEIDFISLSHHFTFTSFHFHFTFTYFHFHILLLSHTFAFTRFDSETNEIDIAPNTRVGTRRYMAPEVRDNDNKMMINRQQKHVKII